MEWIFIIAVVILLLLLYFAVSHISGQVWHLENTIKDTIEHQTTKIERQLEQIYKIMGGDAKKRGIEKER